MSLVNLVIVNEKPVSFNLFMIEYFKLIKINNCIS